MKRWLLAVLLLPLIACGSSKSAAPDLYACANTAFENASGLYRLSASAPTITPTPRPGCEGIAALMDGAYQDGRRDGSNSEDATVARWLETGCFQPVNDAIVDRLGPSRTDDTSLGEGVCSRLSFAFDEWRRR